MGRKPCCDKANTKRGPWSPEEDEALRRFIERYGNGGNWVALPKKAGLKRCGKSCRLRWLNYLRPDIKHGDFTEEEDNIICNLYNKVASRWAFIASHLKGRTDNDVKNYWNTKLKKRLMAAAAAAAAEEEAKSKAAPAASEDGQFMTSSFVLPPIPTIKTETYTYDDFMAPVIVPDTSFFVSGLEHGTSSTTTASASSSLTNWSGSIDQNASVSASASASGSTTTGLFQDFEFGSTTDQLLRYYSCLDPSCFSALGNILVTDHTK